jgi:hypothetical protein
VEIAGRGVATQRLNTGSLPELKPHCLQNYFTDEVFLQRLSK